MTIKRLIGTDPDQIPRNSDLGSMAFQDAAGVTVGKLKVNTSATLLGSATGVAAGVYPLNISDGNTIASALTTSDWMVLSAQGTAPGFTGVVAGTSGSRMVFKGVKAAGTLASPTVPANNEEIVSVLGAIYDGSTTQATAGITFKVDGTVSSGVAPQRIEFQTGTTNSRTTRLTIGSSGTITAATPIVANDVVTINANSTSDALRITQTGSGNALVVEDSANPDSTPFVIDQSGIVISGHTSSVLSGPRIQIVSTAANGFGAVNYSDDVNGPLHTFAKSRGTIASPTIVQSNDTISRFDFSAYDGAANIVGARITASVDGTPGTNDMPGRLVFSTTADGASGPTERMRIDNAGNVGIGATSLTAGRTFVVSKSITGSTTGMGIASRATVQSDVTSYAAGFNTFLTTQATAFTLSSLVHYDANQATIGAGSSITNQYGFFANSSLTGATNNYGFYSNIATGTGRWNFYAAGTAANYFAGNTGIGGLPSGTYTLEVTGDAYISGDLTVNGTTTTINSTTISVDDINIELGSVATPTDLTAEGGGITLKGATDKTINWVGANTAWTSSENFNLLTGKTYKINGTDVLSATTLGSGVVNSSLTSVGTLTGLTVNGTTVSGNTSGSRIRIVESGGDMFVQSGTGPAGTGTPIRFCKWGTTGSTLVLDIANDKVGVGIYAPAAKLDVQGDVIIEASRFDTTTTAISTTTQTEVASYASATYRTAEFLVQVVDSTNSQYHSAKILVIHDGTTVNNVQYGVVHTASELGTFDADISGGNVRLLFTATAATTKTVKVLATMLTA